MAHHLLATVSHWYNQTIAPSNNNTSEQRKRQIEYSLLYSSSPPLKQPCNTINNIYTNILPDYDGQIEPTQTLQLAKNPINTSVGSVSSTTTINIPNTTDNPQRFRCHRCRAWNIVDNMKQCKSERTKHNKMRSCDLWYCRLCYNIDHTSTMCGYCDGTCMCTKCKAKRRIEQNQSNKILQPYNCINNMQLNQDTTEISCHRCHNKKLSFMLYTCTSRRPSYASNNVLKQCSFRFCKSHFSTVQDPLTFICPVCTGTCDCKKCASRNTSNTTQQCNPSQIRLPDKHIEQMDGDTTRPSSNTQSSYDASEIIDLMNCTDSDDGTDDHHQLPQSYESTIGSPAIKSEPMIKLEQFHDNKQRINNCDEPIYIDSSEDELESYYEPRDDSLYIIISDSGTEDENTDNITNDHTISNYSSTITTQTNNTIMAPPCSSIVSKPPIIYTTDDGDTITIDINLLDRSEDYDDHRSLTNPIMKRNLMLYTCAMLSRRHHIIQQSIASHNQSMLAADQSNNIPLANQHAKSIGGLDYELDYIDAHMVARYNKIKSERNKLIRYHQFMRDERDNEFYELESMYECDTHQHPSDHTNIGLYIDKINSNELQLYSSVSDGMSSDDIDTDDDTVISTDELDDTAGVATDYIPEQQLLTQQKGVQTLKNIIHKIISDTPDAWNEDVHVPELNKHDNPLIGYGEPENNNTNNNIPITNTTNYTDRNQPINTVPVKRKHINPTVDTTTSATQTQSINTVPTTTDGHNHIVSSALPESISIRSSSNNEHVMSTKSVATDVVPSRSSRTNSNDAVQASPNPSVVDDMYGKPTSVTPINEPSTAIPPVLNGTKVSATVTPTPNMIDSVVMALIVNLLDEPRDCKELSDMFEQKYQQPFTTFTGHNMNEFVQHAADDLHELELLPLIDRPGMMICKLGYKTLYPHNVRIDMSVPQISNNTVHNTQPDVYGQATPPPVASVTEQHNVSHEIVTNKHDTTAPITKPSNKSVKLHKPSSDEIQRIRLQWSVTRIITSLQSILPDDGGPLSSATIGKLWRNKYGYGFKTCTGLLLIDFVRTTVQYKLFEYVKDNQQGSIRRIIHNTTNHPTNTSVSDTVMNVSNDEDDGVMPVLEHGTQDNTYVPANHTSLQVNAEQNDHSQQSSTMANSNTALHQPATRTQSNIAPNIDQLPQITIQSTTANEVGIPSTEHTSTSTHGSFDKLRDHAQALVDHEIQQILDRLYTGLCTNNNTYLMDVNQLIMLSINHMQLQLSESTQFIDVNQLNLYIDKLLMPRIPEFSLISHGIPLTQYVASNDQLFCSHTIKSDTRTVVKLRTWSSRKLHKSLRKILANTPQDIFTVQSQWIRLYQCTFQSVSTCSSIYEYCCKGDSIYECMYTIDTKQYTVSLKQSADVSSHVQPDSTNRATGQDKTTAVQPIDIPLSVQFNKLSRLQPIEAVQPTPLVPVPPIVRATPIVQSIVPITTPRTTTNKSNIPDIQSVTDPPIINSTEKLNSVVPAVWSQHKLVTRLRQLLTHPMSSNQLKQLFKLQNKRKFRSVSNGISLNQFINQNNHVFIVSTDHKNNKLISAMQYIPTPTKRRNISDSTVISHNKSPTNGKQLNKLPITVNPFTAACSGKQSTSRHINNPHDDTIRSSQRSLIDSMNDVASSNESANGIGDRTAPIELD